MILDWLFRRKIEIVRSIGDNSQPLGIPKYLSKSSDQESDAAKWQRVLVILDRFENGEQGCLTPSTAFYEIIKIAGDR